MTRLSHNRIARRRNAGFSLVELMVGGVLSAILVLGIMSTYVHQRTINKSQQWLADMQQNTRSAIDVMTRDIRNAGYGINVPDADLGLWIDWEPQLITNPTLIDGKFSTPDEVLLAGAYGPSETKLASDADVGDTQISLPSGMGELFNTNNRSLIFLGGLETLRITQISGDVLTVSTHHTDSVGLRFNHPPDSSIELIKVVRYSVEKNPGGYPNRPYLARNTSELDVYYDWQKLFATGVIDLQVAWQGKDILFTVQSQSTLEEIYYTDADTEEGYRTMEMTGRAYRRNQFIP